VPNADWGEGSAHFNSPLCDSGSCGTGGGTAGPRTGSWWAWFGGVSNAVETSFLTQTVDLPSGAAELNFYLWIGRHNGTGAASYVRALIDNTVVFSATDASTAYNGGYTLVAVDLSAFGGGSRTLRIEEYNPSAAAPFNVSVDDVTITTSNHACASPLTASLSASSQSLAEAAGTVTIQANLSRANSQAVSVPFTVGGSASGSGVDHNLAAGTIAIPAGAITGTLAFGLVDDALDESDETIVVTMGTPANAAQGAVVSQTITIQDDDLLPVVALAGSTASVGESAGAISLTVSLNAASGRSVAVQYATSSGSATAGSDYVGATGTLTFAAGTTTQTIVVPIGDDIAGEPNETFIVTLSNPSSASLGAASATVTILDDDLPGFKLYLPVIRRP
jgi:hypothetical protein